MGAPFPDPMDPHAALRPAELARQRDFLCRLARGLLGDAARAEDVVQDALVLALERPPREVRALSTWLGQVVRRLSLNELRRAERLRRHERAAARPESQDSHAEAVACLDAQHFVLAAVRALEEPYKATLWLRYYEGLMPAAIAAREGLPVKTVKTRLARALERLRAELERSSGGDRTAWSALLLPLATRRVSGPLGGAGILGGMLAMKKVVAALAVLAVALLTWRVVGPGEPRPAAGELAAVATEVSGASGTPVAGPAMRSDSAREPLATGSEGSGSEHASAAAALVVHVTWERDGTDASEVGLVALPLADPRPDLRTRHAQTDASGRATFEGLAPGGFTLRTDRDGQAQVELVAGQTAELELSIPAGVDVAGQVVDRDGGPVAGAEIWLTRAIREAWLGGEVVARADAAGRFFLRSVGPRQSVGAFASGFAPAWLEALSAKSWPANDPRVELTLVLERAGAAVEGRVLDPEGVPVPDALVALGSGGFVGVVRRADGRWGTTPSPRTLVTDALGRFRADWLEPGEVPVFVLAEGFALGRADATVAAGETEFVTVSLARGATIAGRVLDPSDQPISGAAVEVQKAGAVVGGCPFSLPKSTSAADGAFRLESVPAGEVTLSARHATDVRLRARSTRTVAEGAAESWDIVLAEAPHIRGRAVDGEGRALVHWKVAAHAETARGMSLGSGLETDDEGRFVVLALDPANAWTLELVHNGVVQDRKEDVHAGAEVVLVGRSEAELGRVTGGFTDAGSRVPEGVRVSARLVAEGNGFSPSPTVDLDGGDLGGGRFAFEGVSPGRYRVRVKTADFQLAESDAFELAPGATVDVGVLASRPSGALVVTLVAPANVVLPDEGVEVDDRWLVRRDGEWRADGLEPGRHWLSTDFPGLAMEQRGFEIEEGRETRLTVTLERGVERRLVFAPGPGIACRSAQVLVRGPTWEISWPAQGTEKPEMTLTLAPGSYAVEATADGGLVARGTLVISDLSVATAEVVFDLR